MKNFLSLCLLFVCVFSSAMANPGGLSGRTTVSSGGCGSCHGSRSTATSVFLKDITSPVQMQPGQTRAFTLTVQNASMPRAGVGISVRTQENGGTSIGMLRPSGTSLRQVGNELTQRTSTAMSGGKVEFAFEWTAPTTPGTYYIHAVGNAVNGNGNDDNNDRWNFMDVVRIEVAQPAAGELRLTDTEVSLGDFYNLPQDTVIPFEFINFIQNAGSEALQIQSITLTGSSEFQLTLPTFPITIAPSQGADIVGVLRPTTPGTKSATITVVSSVGNASFTINALVGGSVSVSDELSPAKQLQVYPHPAADVIRISANLPDGVYKLTLHSVNGMTVFTDEVLLTASSGVVSLPPSLSNGMYMLQLQHGQNSSSLPFMLQR